MQSSRNPFGSSSSLRCLLMPLAGGMLLLSSCAQDYTLVKTPLDQAEQEETFQYRRWIHEGVQPDTVVIALHGFSGASIDYENLATKLLKDQPKTALFAYELRGQGKDPNKERRGDIDTPESWSVDLMTFTENVEKEFPKAKIVWFGESMGGLILSYTYRKQIEEGHKPPCDAIGISSPVVKIRDDFPKWKKELVRAVSKIAPKTRISLETLAGGEEVQMTENSVHSEQSETNSWHIDKHTLRLLVVLGDLIEDMPKCASLYKVPTIILHGGKDFFTTPDDVKTFVSHIPDTTDTTRKYYPNGHHLLMYDDVKDKVIDDISSWVGKL